MTVFWRLPFGKKGIRVTFPVQFMSKSCRGYEYICTSVSFFFKLRPRWCLYELASYLKDENVRAQQRNLQILPVHLCFWPEAMGLERHHPPNKSKKSPICRPQANDDYFA